jgi:tetratricopeptide (TPR) repeat protein
MDPFANRPIYISGNVVLQEGGPAPIETVIELVCDGRPRPEGYVNSKGDFNIQLGRDSQLLSDASTSTWGGRASGGFQGRGIGMGGGQVTERDLIGCEIRASLPGYRSNTVQLAGRRVLDKPDIGTLVLTRLAKVEGLTISATTLHAPKTASKNYDKGMKELRNGKFAKAVPHFEKAVEEYPQYAVAWHALGSAREGLKQLDEAETDYHKALEADGKFVSPYLRLASLAATKQQWDKAEAFSATVIRLNPVDFASAYYINAISNLQLQQFSKAEDSAREAKKMDSSNRMQRLDYFLALILANREKYQEAATLMKAYMKALPEDADLSVLQQQLGQIEKLALSQQPAQNQ